jgi:hypothetical protein
MRFLSSRRPTALPHLEALEDRAVPAVFVVSNTLDAGAGSLRRAILDSNSTPGADQIVFAPRVQGTIALRTGELQILNDLTIVGPGADRLTIDGMGDNTTVVKRVFQVGVEEGSPGGD